MPKTAYVTGSIMGIPKGTSDQAASWELIKYMTTNTDALVKLANGLANVPTTQAAADSPNLHLVPQFQPRIPGYGEIDWGKFMGSLMDTRYRGPVCIEVEDDTFGRSLDGRKQAIKAAGNVLRPFFPEI